MRCYYGTGCNDDKRADTEDDGLWNPEVRSRRFLPLEREARLDAADSFLGLLAAAEGGEAEVALAARTEA